MSDLYATPSGATEPGTARPTGADARRTRLIVLVAASLVLVVGAGTLAAFSLLGLLGNRAAEDLAEELFSSVTWTTEDADGTAEDPSAAPTSGPAGPSGAQPDGAPSVGRNVFAPLVDAAGDATPTSGTASDTATQIPESVPTGGPGVTATLPGPTVTSYAVVTQTVAGPTVTVVSTSAYPYTVIVSSVATPGVDDSAATFTVNGVAETVPVGGTFGSGGFTYVDYTAGSGLVTFTHAGSTLSLPVGGSIAIPGG
jgi:hypothetical protein